MQHINGGLNEKKAQGLQNPAFLIPQPVSQATGSCLPHCHAAGLHAPRRSFRPSPGLRADLPTSASSFQPILHFILFSCFGVHFQNLTGSIHSAASPSLLKMNTVARHYRRFVTGTSLLPLGPPTHRLWLEYTTHRRGCLHSQFPHLCQNFFSAWHHRCSKDICRMNDRVFSFV